MGPEVIQTTMSPFTPTRHFRRKYDRVFKKNPAAANMMLLLCELADERGQVVTDEKELQRLMAARFADFRAYQLPGGPKR
jgi:hypothetical protein